MREDQIAETRRFIDFLNEGIDDAEAFAGEMLALPPSGWDAWLAAHPVARSRAVFTQLLGEAEGMLREDWPLALAITELATRHVDTVPVPPEAGLVLVALRANAWRVHARTLRAAGRPAAAVQAYETAAAILRTERVLYEMRSELSRETAVFRRSLEPPAVPAPEVREELSALEELSHQIAAQLNSNPEEALRIAKRASRLADTLPAALFSPQELANIRGRVHRDHALALRTLARYDQALAQLRLGEKLLAPFDALAYEHALLQFARAITLQEAGRYDDAATALADCWPIIKTQGDERVWLLCRIGQASLLYRTGQLDEACVEWAALMPAARALGDVQVLAATQNNLAHTLVDLGEFAAAEEHLTEAIRLFTEIEQPAQVLRSELARGRILLKRGMVKQGIAHLRQVRAQFLEQKLVEEAGLCGLEIVEADLGRGAARQAEALARQIVRDFTAAHLNGRAVTAVGYLSEAIAARKASAVTVETVRRFIHTLRSDPNAAFLATA